jgi:hypothetical protein
MKKEKRSVSQLLKLLTLVNSVYCGRWQTVRDIVASINAVHGATVLKSSWNNYKKDHPQWYPLDLTKIETWSTYEKCVDIDFFVVDNRLQCTSKIYEGDNMHGYRKDLRFTATILLPNKFIYNISDNIEWALDQMIEDAHETHLALLKSEWKNNLKQEFLTKTKRNAKSCNQ